MFKITEAIIRSRRQNILNLEEELSRVRPDDRRERERLEADLQEARSRLNFALEMDKGK